jgi:hypothetical protein
MRPQPHSGSEWSFQLRRAFGRPDSSGKSSSQVIAKLRLAAGVTGK